jgi:2-phosphosulfolactate phosphatase
MSRKIEVCLTPAVLNLYDISDSIVVVIDVLRATSSITYGIDNGAEAIIPVAQVEDCLNFADSGYLLAAERNGEVVAGYDFGNSPFSYTKEKVNGKTIVLTTTNGTKALHMARESAYQVVIGSFLNLTSLSNWLKSQDKNVLLLCAGWKDKFNLEDTLFAGAVIERVKAHFTIHCDSSLMAENMYQLHKNDLKGFIRNTTHWHRLAQYGLEKDLEYCVTPDQANILPFYKNGDLIVK